MGSRKALSSWDRKLFWAYDVLGSRQNRLFFGFDIAGSFRMDFSLATVRDVPIRPFRRSVRSLGPLCWCTILDEGDSEIAILSPRICAEDVIKKAAPNFVGQIAAAEATGHTKYTPPLRLRMAVHRGSYIRDPWGRWSGTQEEGLGLMFRILSAQDLKDFHNEQCSRAVLALSEVVAQEVQIDPATWTHLEIHNKETETTVWARAIDA